MHRGRRLRFPALPGLRPTADRVRETLFNWLQPCIAGADCLDLFAGSGALGLESASRGAHRVVMLDRSRSAVIQIREHVRVLGLEQVSVEQTDVLRWLRGSAERFDVVFVDPPFAGDLAGVCCQELERGGWLKADARIYLEMDNARPLPILPPNWRRERQGRAGQVGFYLYAR